MKSVNKIIAKDKFKNRKVFPKFIYFIEDSSKFECISQSYISIVIIDDGSLYRFGDIDIIIRQFKDIFTHNEC